MRFPCLRLAFAALGGGGGLPIVLNAANEVAVSAFLESRLRFTAIPEVIEGAMARYEREAARPIEGLDDVREVDRWARAAAAESAGKVQSVS